MSDQNKKDPKPQGVGRREALGLTALAVGSVTLGAKSAQAAVTAGPAPAAAEEQCRTVKFSDEDKKAIAYNVEGLRKVLRRHDLDIAAITSLVTTWVDTGKAVEVRFAEQVTASVMNMVAFD